MMGKFSAKNGRLRFDLNGVIMRMDDVPLVRRERLVALVDLLSKQEVEQSGIHLNPQEACLFFCLCRGVSNNFNFANTQDHDDERFSDLAEKANIADYHDLGLPLTPEDVKCFSSFATAWLAKQDLKSSEKQRNKAVAIGLPRPKALQDQAHAAPKHFSKAENDGQKSQSQMANEYATEKTGQHFTNIIGEIFACLAEQYPDISSELKQLTSPEETLEFIKKVLVSLQKQLSDTRRSLDVKQNELVSAQSDIEQVKRNFEEKYTKPLQKKIIKKEKALVDKERELMLAWESNHRREEGLKLERNRVEAEAENLKHELEKSRKEPEKVREQWSRKVQKLHDRVTAKNAELLSMKEDNEILKLDNGATLEDLGLCREQIADLQAKLDSQKTSVENIENLIKKNEGLQKSLLVAKTNQRIEADNLRSAVLEATARLTAEVKQMKQLREDDSKMIDEVSQSNESLKIKIAALERSLAENEVLQNATLDQLEKERANTKAKENDDTVLELEQDLMKERARSNQLEKNLAPFIVAAAALKL
ncbi:hypothetical protein EG329_012301 [Mollisiaceae sp. DMI_Dod_QoI]|nr:hypothetical protein EG329_012301 [Helotiales sp. DMI_Dod_QoI]